MISTRYRIYQGIAMTSLGLFILMIGSQGELGQYISPRLIIIMLLSSAALIGLAQVIFQIRKKDVEAGRLLSQGHQKNRLRWFILPVAAGLLLTVHHPETRFMNVNGLLLRQRFEGSESPSYVLLEPLPNKRSIRDWLMVYDVAPDREALTGHPVVMTGVVHHDQRISGDVFLLYRFVTGAGLGDSYAAGILILWSEWDRLEEGAWVRVTGRLDHVQLDWLSEPLPLIIALEVQDVQPALQTVEQLDGRD